MLLVELLLYKMFLNEVRQGGTSQSSIQKVFRISLQQTGSLVSRVFDCLDIFGASGRVKDTWDSAGYKAVGYDLKLDLGHDIVSESGFKTLLTYGLQPLSSSYVWVILLFVCQV